MASQYSQDKNPILDMAYNIMHGLVPIYIVAPTPIPYFVVILDFSLVSGTYQDFFPILGLLYLLFTLPHMCSFIFSKHHTSPNSSSYSFLRFQLK